MESIWLITHRRLVAFICILICINLIFPGCGRPRLKFWRKEEKTAAYKPQKVKVKVAPSKDVSPLVDDDYWRDASLKVLWHARLSNQPVVTQIAGRHLVIADNMNMVYAISRDKGIVRWRQDAGYEVNGISVGLGDLVVHSQHKFTRLSEDKGNLYWSKTIDFVPSSDVVRSQYRICAPGWGRTIWSMDAEDCRVLWRTLAADNVLSKIIDSGTRIYVLSENGCLSALDGQTGDEEWNIQLDASATAGLSAYENNIYVGSRNKVFYACSKLGGQIQWQYFPKGPIVECPEVTENSVYFKAEDDGMYCLDHKGNLKWKYEGDVAVLSEAPEVTYLVRYPNDIIVVDSNDGKERLTVNVPGFSMFLVNMEGPELFCLSESGDIIALGRI